MRRTRRNAVAALAIAVCVAIQLGSAFVAGAEDQPDGAGARAVPAHRVDGSTGGELLGQVWSVWYSTPQGEAPACIPLGRTGDVLHAARRDTICTVEQGTALMLFWSTTCDDVIDPAVNTDFYGADEAAQRDCALAWDEALVRDLRVTVDNGTAVDVHNARFEVYSPQQHVQLPPDNFYGITPRPATFTAHGWVAVVRNLRPGLHTTQFELSFTGGEIDTLTRTVNVVGDQDHCCSTRSR